MKELARLTCCVRFLSLISHQLSSVNIERPVVSVGLRHRGSGITIRFGLPLDIHIEDQLEFPGMPLHQHAGSQTERFVLMAVEDARKAGVQDEEEILDAGWDEEWDTVLVDKKKNLVVATDGSTDSPEDNFLYRHFGVLVDLLNEVDAENNSEPSRER